MTKTSSILLSLVRTQSGEIVLDATYNFDDGTEFEDTVSGLTDEAVINLVSGALEQLGR